MGVSMLVLWENLPSNPSFSPDNSGPLSTRTCQMKGLWVDHGNSLLGRGPKSKLCHWKPHWQLFSCMSAHTLCLDLDLSEQESRELLA